MLPRSWKKAFNNGVIIPKKIKFCNECNDKKLCYKCNNQNNENKEFEASLNLLKNETSLVICYPIILNFPNK